MSERKVGIRKAIPTPNYYRQFIIYWRQTPVEANFNGKGKVREEERYKKMKVQTFVANKNQQLQLQMYHKLF